MKYSALLLFLIGAFLEASALVLAFPERFPFLFRLISPDYHDGLQALRVLDRRGPLVPESQGFPAVESIVLRLLRENGPPDLVKTMRITQVTRTKTVGSLKVTSRGVSKAIPLEVHLSDGQKIPWDLVKLRQEVENLKAANLFWWSVGLLCMGIVVQLVGLRVQGQQK